MNQSYDETRADFETLVTVIRRSPDSDEKRTALPIAEKYLAQVIASAPPEAPQAKLSDLEKRADALLSQHEQSKVDAAVQEKRTKELLKEAEKRIEELKEQPADKATADVLKQEDEKIVEALTKTGDVETGKVVEPAEGEKAAE